ncbi:MAG TPA: serine/threonine-protein kinase [Usitatibacter sp.]|nr:serine/threonine-protein kinase [Usitatibacter sp.]
MDALPARFGRFRVLSQLGRGAMGVVYRAEDTTLGRIVAIKTIALGGVSGAERDQNEARFLQEARAAARISHPAIVTIYEMGREGDVAFIAMELLEGADLRDLIRDGSLSPSQALTIAASVAEGLACAHEQGVVHRDVKPGNIIVLADGRVKIMDFGIARLREPAVKTETGLLLGSPQYMAPEQIVGQPFDHRADIFSLGLVLYEMLTGVKPFAGEDIAELTFKVANLPAPPPSHYARGLPAVVDLIVARALRKKPEDRYADAAEFARDLWAAIPEVRAAEAAGIERTAYAQTVPRGAAPGAATGAPGEVIELRPSPRFDSTQGMARLTVMAPEGEPARTNAQAAPVPARVRRARVDPAGLAVAALYVLAAIAAVLIAVG